MYLPCCYRASLVRSLRTPTRRIFRWALVALGVVVVILVLDAAWLGFTTRSHLESARDDIRTGADALVAGDIDGAAAAFEDAKGAASSAGSISWHPAGFLAQTLPWIGDDVHAVDDLASAAAITAEAGQTITGAARRVGWDGNGLPGVSSGSGISPDVLEQMAPEIASAHEDLVQAQAMLDDVSTAGLLTPVSDAVLTARSELAGRATLVGSASDVAKLLPGLFADGNRYLLIVQNPGETRGTGGFMGFYGTLVSDGSSLQLTELRPADGVQVPPVEAPADYVKRYAKFESLIDLRQSNFSPDLPTVAGVVTQMAEARGWGSYDGIFLVDPIWMKYMLAATGPVSVEGLGEVSAATVVSVVGEQLPLLPKEDADRLQGELATAIWEATQTGDISPSTFATGLARSVAERHLQLWSVDPAQEAIITDLGAAGNADLGTNPLYVVWQNIAANKVGIYAQRSIEVDVTLRDQGTAVVTTTLSLENTATPGPVSQLLGSGGDNFAVGTFEGYVSIYEPVGIQGTPTYEASAPTATGHETEFGHPVTWGIVAAAPGESMTWSVTYVVPDATTAIGDGSEYRLDYLPQPAYAAPSVSVTIHLPDGSTVSERSPGVAGDGTTVTYQDRPSTPTAIWVRYR